MLNYCVVIISNVSAFLRSNLFLNDISGKVSRKLSNTNCSGTNLDATLTFDPETCPYCTKAAGNDSEGTETNETADSDSEGVYEFTQDAHYKDNRDPNKKRKFQLGARAAKVVHFWRLVCDTFRKIVDSKYFGRGIMIAILINTLSMGIEYHEQVSVGYTDRIHN